MSIETALSGLLQQQSSLINTFYSQIDTWNAAVDTAISSLSVSINELLQQGSDTLLTRTIYVDATSGVDTNAGTLAAPVKSIKKAIELVPSFAIGTIYLKCQQTHDIDSDIVLNGVKLNFSQYGTTDLTNNTIDDFTNINRTQLPKIRQKWMVSGSTDRLVRGYQFKSYYPSRYSSLVFLNCQIETFTAPTNTEANSVANGYHTDETLGFIYAPTQNTNVFLYNCDVHIKQDNFMIKTSLGELTPLSLTHCQLIKYQSDHVPPQAYPDLYDGKRFLYVDISGGLVVIQLNQCMRPEGVGITPVDPLKPYKDFVSMTITTPKNYLTNFAVE